jgi:nucleotide-binding universal stress UspA family protein
MFNKIVVPLDGSPLAEVALPYAEEIAGKMGTEMILLTVLPSEEPQEYRNHHIYGEKLVDITRLHVEKYFKNPGIAGCRIDTVTEVGNPAEGILDYVVKRNMSLVVMATHGRSGLSRWAIGSVADKVVRSKASQPLLIIRARGAHPDVRARRIMKKALVPLDGSKESESVIPFITNLAGSLQMELILFRAIAKVNHTRSGAEEYLSGWRQKFMEQGISATFQVRAGSPADCIIELADETACDVVAMATHGQTAVPLWPLGSVAQKVLLGGNTPLLLVRS